MRYGQPALRVEINGWSLVAAGSVEVSKAPPGTNPAAGRPREPPAAAGENPDMLEFAPAAWPRLFEEESYPGAGSAAVS